MPRELIPIETFSKGTIGAISPNDIPNDAASFSIDVDNSIEQGILRGRNKDWESSGVSGVPQNLTITKFITESNGTNTLVGFDKETGDVGVYENFPTPGAGQGLTILGSSSFAGMEVYNKAIHLGYNRTADTKWIGRIEKGQIGQSAPTGLQCMRAELELPVGLPFFYKVVAVGNYYYAITWQGQCLYKIKISDGTFTKSTDLFTSIQAICEHVTASGTTILLLDFQGLGAPPILYRIATPDTAAAPILDVTWTPLYPTGFGSVGYFISFNDMETTRDSNGYTHKVYVTARDETSWVYSRLFSEISSSANFKNVSPVEIPSSPIWAETWKGVVPSTPSMMRANEEQMSIAVWCVQLSECQIVIISDTYDGVDSTIGDIAIHVKDGTYMATWRVNSASYPWGNSTPLGVAFNSTNNFIVYIFPLKDGIKSYLATISIAAMGSITAANDQDYWIEYTTYGKYASPMLNVTQIQSLFPTGTDSLPLAPVDRASGTDMALFAIGTSNSNNAAIRNIEWSSGFVAGSVVGSVIVEITVEAAVGIGYFDIEKKYFYTYSFEYDNIQESPLQLSVYATFTPTLSTSTIATVTTKIRVDAIGTTLSKRITKIKIYRAEGPSTATFPVTLFRFVDTVDMSKGWTVSGSQYIVAFTDIGINGSSYETETGISQTLSHNCVIYEIDTQFQGFHFVARCAVRGIDDATRMLFRSKQDCFDQFDWSNDFVMLPKIPTAIVAFNGSIFVYAENESYRINPIGMYIEDIYEGVGVPGERCVAVTEFGIFLCNRENIYMHDGKTLTAIGSIIKTITNPNGSGYSWEALANEPETDLVVCPLIAKNSILFMTFPYQVGYAFNYLAKRFDCWDMRLIDSSHIVFNSRHNGLFTAPNALVYLSGKPVVNENSGLNIITEAGAYITTEDSDYLTIGDQTTSGMQSIANSSDRKPFQWQSKFFALDSPDQIKKFYSVDVDNASATVTVGYDNIYTGYTTFTPSRKKSMIVDIIGTAYTEIMNLTIQFRRMIGIR